LVLQRSPNEAPRLIGKHGMMIRVDAIVKELDCSQEESRDKFVNKKKVHAASPVDVLWTTNSQSNRNRGEYNGSLCCCFVEKKYNVILFIQAISCSGCFITID
jgi:hypothetical protein